MIRRERPPSRTASKALPPMGSGDVRWPPWPRRGHARSGEGWAAAWPAVPAWRMTSDQAPVLWPLPTQPTSAGRRGADRLGPGVGRAVPRRSRRMGARTRRSRWRTRTCSCSASPAAASRPPSRRWCCGCIDCGYRALVLGDPKDEYAPLCRALGVEPIEIGPGLPGRINPLRLRRRPQLCAEPWRRRRRWAAGPG